MRWSMCSCVVCIWWVLFTPTAFGLQTYQQQVLLQVRKHLENPPFLDLWGNYDGDLCYVPSDSHVSVICQDDVVTELKIMGDMRVEVVGVEFDGFAILNQTLSDTFSIDSLVTTLARLTSLKVVRLVSLGIWGQLPDKIHRLTSLELLDLSSNYMFGAVPPRLSRLVKLNSLALDGNYFNATVPDWLDSLSNLTVLSLKNNRFTGPFPASIRKIRTLTDLALSHNQITGELPDLSALTNLHVLDLRENRLNSHLPAMPKGLTMLLVSNNSFSGNIPTQYGELSQVQYLDLSINHLSGPPPSSLFSLPNISYLKLSSNVLSGSLPTDLKCGGKLGFVDISSNKLIGELPRCLDGKSDTRVVKFSGNCLSEVVPNQHKRSFCKEVDEERRRSRSRGLGVLIAIICGAAIVIGILAYGFSFLCRKCRSRSTIEHNIVSKVIQDDAIPVVSPEVHADAGFVSQAHKLGTQSAPVCRAFSLEELKDATNNFDSSRFIGEGSTSKVYRGRLENGSFVAIRSLSLMKKQSIPNLKVRLDLLSKLHHPHLVSLQGHCIDPDVNDDTSSSKLFLVYEYMPNGSYHTHLLEASPEKVLKWSDRLAILIGVAKAVHFLHTGVIPGTCNNRLRTNNILLDEHRIAKLSDYGMSIITEGIEKLEVKGEGTKSRHKNNLEDDVYNFSFILLESLVGPIVTGKGEAFLLNEMASFGSQDGRRRIMDPIVLTTCSQESLSTVVSLTSKCMSPEPSARPSFEDVLWNLQYAAQLQATADAEQKSHSNM